MIDFEKYMKAEESYTDKISPSIIQKEKNNQLKELSDLIRTLNSLSSQFKNIKFIFDNGIKDYYYDIKRIKSNDFTKEDIGMLRGKKGIHVVRLIFNTKNKDEYLKQMDMIFMKIHAADFIRDIYSAHQTSYSVDIKMSRSCSDEFKKAIKNYKK